MLRIVFSLLLIFFSAIPCYSEQPEKKKDSSNVVKVRETYKINAQIEYNDNEVETIYLDEDIEKPQVNIPQKTLTLPVGSLNITSNNPVSRSALARAMVTRHSLGDIVPFGGSLVESLGGFSYGQTWERDISYSQLEDTTSFFLRYDAPKFLSIQTSIRNAANQDIGTLYNTLRITPELRLSDRFTLKNSFTTYMNLPKNKNEITIVYTPHLKKYADALKFELGYAESYYRNGRRSSAISFSTGFQL